MRPAKDALLKLGEYLRSLREAKGLSVRQLADQLGLESSYVSKIEHGDRVPSEAVLGSLAGVFEISPHLLMAMSGQVTRAFIEAMQRYPKAFATLIEGLPKASEQTVVRAARAVRDGDW